MSASLALSMYPARHEPESPDHIPVELDRLLAANPGQEEEQAWATFVSHHSGLLLRVAWSFAPGYDGTLDRYAFMLEELRKSNYRRLHRFAANGRGRFSTWLTVVARRLCLDHHRQQYGRFRSHVPAASERSVARAARRELATLRMVEIGLVELAAPSSTDPADELDDRERRAALRRAIGELMPGDQLLIRLRFDEDLTAREIARVLGLPSPFHVYRRLDSIFRTLRQQLTRAQSRHQATA